MHMQNPLVFEKGGDQNKLDDLSTTFLEAAKKRDSSALRQCIRFGVDVNVREGRKGNAALHLVLAQGCYSKNCIIKTERCLKVLLRNKANANLANYGGHSPLNFVVDHAVPTSLAKLLVSYGATLVKGNGLDNPALAQKIAVKKPELAAALLDRAVSFSPEKTVEIDGLPCEAIKLDWRYLVYNSDVSKVRVETKFLNDVLQGSKENRKIILTHPVVKALIRLKTPLYWRHFGLFYFVWICLTLLLYIICTWIIYNQVCKYGNDNYNSTCNLLVTNTTDSYDYLRTVNQSSDDDEETDSSMYVGTPCCIDLWLSITAFVTFILFICGPAFLQWRKLVAVGYKVYFTDWPNYVFNAAAMSVSITLYPALLAPFKKDNLIILEWEFGFSAVGMLVGSIYILIQMTPIPFVALYLEMMFKILFKILLAFLAFCPLVFGFYLAFQILLPKELGPFKLLTMITTDTDYELLKDDNRDDFYDLATYFAFSLFIVIIVVVLLNFLIGLAVNDIQELIESAKATNLANQVRSYYLMDSVYGNRRRNNRAVTKGGRAMSYIFHPLDENDPSVLPEDLKLELLQLARARCSHPITYPDTNIKKIQQSFARMVKLNNNAKNRKPPSKSMRGTVIVKME